MTQEEYNSIDWNRGNTVRLDNGKEYYVKGVKKRFLLLYSEEYDSYFVSDHRIIESRTSDYIEPYEEKVKPVEEPKPATKTATKKDNPAMPEKKIVIVQEPEAKQIAKAEPVAKVEPAEQKEAAAPEQPKRKRKRITIKRAEKVKY